MRAAKNWIRPPIFCTDLGISPRTVTQKIGKFGSLFNFVNCVTGDEDLRSVLDTPIKQHIREPVLRVNFHFFV